MQRPTRLALWRVVSQDESQRRLSHSPRDLEVAEGGLCARAWFVLIDRDAGNLALVVASVD